MALVAKVLHPHVLGDGSSTEVTAGRTHRIHLHKALHFIYISKENGLEAFRHTQKKASLQSYRCLLQSNNTNHSFLPRRNPPRTGVKQSRKLSRRIGCGTSQMVQTAPSRQTAKLCAAHEGRSSVGLDSGEVPLGLENRPCGDSTRR